MMFYIGNKISVWPYRLVVTETGSHMGFDHGLTPGLWCLETHARHMCVSAPNSSGVSKWRKRIAACYAIVHGGWFLPSLSGQHLCPLAVWRSKVFKKENSFFFLLWFSMLIDFDELTNFQSIVYVGSSQHSWKMHVMKRHTWFLDPPPPNLWVCVHLW